MEPKYTTEALSTGDARNGHVEVKDGGLAFDLAAPKEMGGSGEGSNPEQLFAAGYAACFHQALKAVSRKAGAASSASAVGAKVSIGDNGQGGMELAVALEVVLPHVDREQAQELAEQAHQMCPYSNATRGNIEVTVSVEED